MMVRPSASGPPSAPLRTPFEPVGQILDEDGLVPVLEHPFGDMPGEEVGRRAYRAWAAAIAAKDPKQTFISLRLPLIVRRKSS
jgi:hypothetical protein